MHENKRHVGATTGRGFVSCGATGGRGFVSCGATGGRGFVSCGATTGRGFVSCGATGGRGFVSCGATTGRGFVSCGATTGRGFVLVVVALCVGWAGSARGVDHVTLRRDGKEIHVSGRVLVTARDGGLLVETRDGVLWGITPKELVQHTSDNAPFEPLSAREMSQRLLAELPAGFEVHQTAHYTICHNTSRRYAQWCGGLFERLYRAFHNYWTNRGFQLFEPEFPLVAIIFADQASFVKFSRGELGDAASSVIGYFSLRTNRMVMYDLTGVERYRRLIPGGNPRVPIETILAQPEALRQVATIVHEATHQIAFNCGLHRRYSDCPSWFTEGIAMFFETPDLSSATGWRSIGTINRPRLVQFRKYLRNRPADSLRTLIADDQRFRHTKTGLDAYAEAWSLTYYLIRRYPRQYVAYLKMLSEKRPLLYDDPQTRVKEFESAFGDLNKLDAEFVRYVQRLR